MRRGQKVRGKVVRCIGTSQAKYSTNLSIERPQYIFFFFLQLIVSPLDSSSGSIVYYVSSNVSDFTQLSLILRYWCPDDEMLDLTLKVNITEITNFLILHFLTSLKALYIIIGLDRFFFTKY